MSERAVSVTVNYALNLAVATMLLAGLLSVAGGMVEDRRESAIRSELRVIGERVAANLMAADRMAAAGSPDATVRIEVSLPDRVAGAVYRVRIVAGGGNPHVLLETDSPGVSVAVPFRTATGVEPSEHTGGDLSVVLAADGDLEVRRE